MINKKLDKGRSRIYISGDTVLILKTLLLCDEGRGLYQTVIFFNRLEAENCFLGPYILDAVGRQCPWRGHSSVMFWIHICGRNVS